MNADERFQKILSEIDPDNSVKINMPLIEQPKIVHKTAKEIADIILGNTTNAITLQTDIINEAKTEENVTTIPFAQTGSLLDLQSLDHELKDANESWNITYYRPIRSHRKVIGNVIVFGKKVFRKFAKFLVEPLVVMQNSFNAAVVRALNIFRNNDVVFESRISVLQNELIAQRQIIEDYRKLIDDMNSSFENKLYGQQQEINRHKQFIDDMNSTFENKLFEQQQETEKYKELLDSISSDIETRLQQEISNNRTLSDTAEKLENSTNALGEKIAKLEKTVYKDEYSQIDYFHFQNEFRGKREDIKEILREYLTYFKGCKQVVDLGSGRGEFLELLKENGIDEVGIEPYAPFADYCQNRGLNVIKTDALTYIKEQKDQSLDGIISIQMIEHINTDYLISLCKECYRTLDYGRKLIFETPNPTSVSTYLNSFYLDPSHNKPVHPKLIEYILKKAGFTKVDIIYTEQSRVDYRLPLLDSAGAANLGDFNNGVNFMTDILFGSQDYCVIAEK